MSNVIVSAHLWLTPQLNIETGVMKLFTTRLLSILTARSEHTGKQSKIIHQHILILAWA